MQNILDWINIINDLVWGIPLLVFLLFSGIYLTIKLKGVQFKYFIYAHKLAFTRSDKKSKGDISHFQALMTALAATIGIGSITGVATAISIGGLGSIFWMWIAAIFGMATKFAEGVLAIKYRVVDERNEMCGGPMYYLDKGLNSKFLGVIFAIFAAITALGTGNMVQANSVSDSLSTMLNVNPVWVGVFLIIIAGLPLIGGIKSIGKVAGILVPTMALFYFVGSLIVILINIKNVPFAFVSIFKGAFTGQAAAGGFVGSTVMMAIQLGVSRGIFSSEAGLGTSSIAAAAAKTDLPCRQALVSMCSVFITTGIVCTMTGLVIATTGVVGELDVNGVPLVGALLVMRAFDKAILNGGVIVTISIIPFAYSTILGWAYYGEKAIEYLFGIRGTIPYRILYTLVLLPGSILNLNIVWGFANIMNGLMAFPNLIGLVLLSGVVASETKTFAKLLKKEKV